jgi:hypothetical protein
MASTAATARTNPKVMALRLRASIKRIDNARYAAKRNAQHLIRAIVPDATAINWETESEYNDEGGYFTIVDVVALSRTDRTAVDLPAREDAAEIGTFSEAMDEQLAGIKQAHPDWDAKTLFDECFARSLDIPREHVAPLLEAITHLVWCDPHATHVGL